MIEDFFTTTFTVMRPEWDEDEDGNRYSELLPSASFDAHIQQASLELVQHFALSLAKAYAIWAPADADVRQGDQLTDEDGNLYVVRAVMQNNLVAGAANPHLELAVELQEPSDYGS